MQETLQAADGHRLAAYRAAPSGKPRGALVVVQEIFGVNSHIRSIADGYAADGWLAVAPAMFDRIERGIELGYAPADIERGRRLKGGCSNDHALLVHGTTSDRVGDIAFAAGVPVHELVAEGSSLEEIFLDLTSEPQP